MQSMTITITDVTKKPRSLADLLDNGTGNGYTVVGSFPAGNPLPVALSVGYLFIQASYTNGATIVYRGDENVKNDGSRQAQEMVNGDSITFQMPGQTSINLNQIFLTASANSAKVNVEWYYA